MTKEIKITASGSRFGVGNLSPGSRKANLSDRIAVVNEGKFLQIGTYDELDLESVKKSKF